MKKALVLSGGGSKGAFEVGVLRQLTKIGYTPDALYGTSTGALNASGIAFLGVQTLTDVWLAIKSTKDIYEPKDPSGIPVNEIADLVFGSGCGLYNSAPLRKLIERVVQGKPSIPVTVCKVSLITSEKSFPSIPASYTGTLDQFHKDVLASASTPILVDLVDYEWGDGGIRSLTPVKKAIQDGFDDITCILADPFKENISLGNGHPGNVADTAIRTISCMVQQIFYQEIQEAIEENKVKLTIYAPLFNLGDANNFDPINIKNWMALGESIAPVYLSLP